MESGSNSGRTSSQATASSRDRNLSNSESTVPDWLKNVSVRFSSGDLNCNPNLQAAITHASHVCSQRSFGLPLKKNGMHKTQFDHTRFKLLFRVI